MSLFGPKVKCSCIACGGPIYDKEFPPACSLCGYSLHYQCALNNLSRYSPQQIGWFQRSYRFGSFVHYGRMHHTFCPACQKLLKTQFLTPMIQRLELTARYDELAQLYEDFGYLAESGMVRNRKNHQVIKNMNIDVNNLIDQMKSGSLNVPYKCTSCGASLTIHSDLGENGVRYCTYCGTAINIEAVSNLIKQALK